MLAAFARADDAPAVHVKYAAGKTELATLADGVKLFANRDYVLQNLPTELNGLSFTRRPGGLKTTAELSTPKDATVYVLISKGAATGKWLRSNGWTDVGDLVYSKGEGVVVFRRTFTSSRRITLRVQSFSGAIFAAAKLNVSEGTVAEPTTQNGPEESAVTEAGPEPVDDTPVHGAATRPAAQQATVRALEIYRTDSGLMLGQTSEATLTLTAGDKPHAVNFGFATHTGRQMELARDEAVRYLRLKYPNWYVTKAELTFEDKYVDHDGGSIGTALGTLALSAIEGFSIDPNVAITGDISANGKVRAIGGVAAKLKGAAASRCVLTAVPADNYDQFVDGVIYNGPALATDTQVIGIATLEDAVNVVRVDRDPKLAEAVTLFDELRTRLKDKPHDLTAKPTQDALAKIAELAPQHLSARVLLAASHGKLPKTLSATASVYYTTLAAKPMLAVLKDRSTNKGPSVPSGLIRSGLADLRKLRPMADPNVRPLIDAWTRFISAWSDVQQHSGSLDALDRARQALLDESAKESADADMMQKMLREGM